MHTIRDRDALYSVVRPAPLVPVQNDVLSLQDAPAQSTYR